MTPNDIITTVFATDTFHEEYGSIRIEEWPEGLMVRIGGRARWKSWESTHETRDLLALLSRALGYVSNVDLRYEISKAIDKCDPRRD